MDISGYNQEAVNGIGDAIVASYKTLATQIGDKIQEQLVSPMSLRWYAPEAQTTFEEIRKSVAALGPSLQEAYKAYRDWIQKVGENWAENTGGLAPSLCDVEMNDVTINVSIIQEATGNGSVILDEQGAINIANNMADLHSELLGIVQSEHAKLNANSAFFGHGQAEAANKCFVRVAEAIGGLFKMLEELGDVIKEYAAKYKKVAENIANELNTVSISVDSSSGSSSHGR